MRFKHRKHLTMLPYNWTETMRRLGPKLLLGVGIVLLLPLAGMVAADLLPGTTNLAVVAPSVAVTFAIVTLAGIAAVSVAAVTLVTRRRRRRRFLT